MLGLRVSSKARCWPSPTSFAPRPSLLPSQRPSQPWFLACSLRLPFAGYITSSRCFPGLGAGSDPAAAALLGAEIWQGEVVRASVQRDAR